MAVVRSRSAPWQIWLTHPVIVVAIFMSLVLAISKIPLRYVQQAWQYGGDECQGRWDRFLDYVGEDRFNLTVFGTSCFSFVVYWMLGLVFLAVDFFEWPRWTRHYKVQPGTNEPLNLLDVKDVFRQVLFNQFCIILPLTVGLYYAGEWSDSLGPVRQLPTFAMVLRDYIVYIACEEILIYYIHRFVMHNRTLYKHIHKQHHQWKAPIAIVGMYAHPLEFIILHLPPTVVASLISRPHLTSAWFWVALMSIQSLGEHSGYRFPGLPRPELHDGHHERFNVGFGLWGFLDYLHETDGGIWQSDSDLKKL